MRKYKSANREQIQLLPTSVQDYLPEDHLARYIVEVLEQLDITSITNKYGLKGSEAYDPALLLALLFYAYSTGIFSSRKIEKATYESIPFMYITGGLHPDHDTINNFRSNFLCELKGIFVQITLIAKEMGFLKLGQVSIDGSKVKANASKHKAMSYGRASELEKELTEEIERLFKMAEQAEYGSEISLDIPEEIKIREKRLEGIKIAQTEIEKRAQERYKQEKIEYDNKMVARAEKEEETGKKPRGTEPKPPDPTPNQKDQYNFTDPESRIMKGTGKSFEQSYNYQAVVDMDSMLIAGTHVTNHANDKEELGPALESVSAELGKIDKGAADSGYFSEANIKLAESRGIDIYIPPNKVEHNRSLQNRLNNHAIQLPENASVVESPSGYALIGKGSPCIVVV